MHRPKTMLEFPTELASMVCEELFPWDVAHLSRASRAHQALYEPLLYRLYAMYQKWSSQRMPVAVTWAVKCAAQQPEMRAVAEATLAKVERFCQLRCGDLDNVRVYGSGDSLLSGCLVYNTKLRTTQCTIRGQLLHVAASAGMDGIVAWLLRHGADVNAPLLGFNYGKLPLTPLYVAVSANRVSIAVQLLAYGARLDVETASAEADAAAHSDSGVYIVPKIPNVMYVACGLGYATMAEKLLIHADNSHCRGRVDLNRLLFFYATRSSNDVPAIATLLLRRGATFSEDTLRALFDSNKLQSTCELVASPTSSGQITADLAYDILVKLSLYGKWQWETAPSAKRAVQQLLDAGADPSLGQHLWFHASHWGWGVILKLLPPFLDAGMVLRHDAEDKNSKREGRGEAQPVDLLGETSPYEENQDEEGNDAKLAIVRLLLQYGAPIQGTTRAHALDAYDGRPPDDGMHSIAAWAYRLSSVLLDHCRSTPPNRRGADIEAFLQRYQTAEAGAQRRMPLLKGLQ